MGAGSPGLLLERKTGQRPPPGGCERELQRPRQVCPRPQSRQSHRRLHAGPGPRRPSHQTPRPLRLKGMPLPNFTGVRGADPLVRAGPPGPAFPPRNQIPPGLPTARGRCPPWTRFSPTKSASPWFTSRRGRRPQRGPQDRGSAPLPMSDAATPLMRQYHNIKQQVPNALLMFRLGDFYELFFEDAVVAARELEITLTSRNKEKGAAI